MWDKVVDALCSMEGEAVFTLSLSYYRTPPPNPRVASSLFLYYYHLALSQTPPPDSASPFRPGIAIPAFAQIEHQQRRIAPVGGDTPSRRGWQRTPLSTACTVSHPLRVSGQGRRVSWPILTSKLLTTGLEARNVGRWSFDDHEQSL